MGASEKLLLSSTKKRKANKLSSDEEGDETSLTTYEFKRKDNRKKNAKKALKSSPKTVRNDTSENDSEYEHKAQAQPKQRNLNTKSSSEDESSSKILHGSSNKKKVKYAII